MTLVPARIVPAQAVGDSARVELGAAPAEARARIVPAVIVDAAERAAKIERDAEARARQLVNEAEARRAELFEQARVEGRAAAVTELAERSLRLARLEADADERALVRSIELSRLLAERLLGEALRLDPSHVAALAENAVAEARGARRITVVAHPDDAAELERALAAGRLERVTRVVTSPERRRGSLRLDTELGVLDADLAPQLDRLVEALRASLRHEP